MTKTRNVIPIAARRKPSVERTPGFPVLRRHFMPGFLAAWAPLGMTKRAATRFRKAPLTRGRRRWGSLILSF